jgi:hypothetical protein
MGVAKLNLESFLCCFRLNKATILGLENGWNTFDIFNFLWVSSEYCIRVQVTLQHEIFQDNSNGV